ncbi:MAG TPA: alpha/beta hydrolase [Gammaproteobacteria bacterium]|nr:alpha/beta hydrolase [Gammaproteobacteria bacterium]
MNLSRLSCGLLLLALAAPCLGAETVDCHIGSYRLADGSFVDVAPLDDGMLRWRRFDGSTGALHPGAGGKWTSTLGWTKQPDGISVSFSDCGTGAIEFNGMAGKRIAFDVQDATFMSHGTRLEGRLVMPAGSGKVPVVVLVHGSEPDSALTGYSLQRMLPAVGIGAFVYDKRGTGKSGGKYTQDFALLADDVVQAVVEAKRLAGPRLGRIGLQGGSEGGWVAPIAANQTHVDFVIVCFGLAVNVLQEDQEGVELQMREKGYPPDVIAKALEVARAAEQVMVSDMQAGYPALDAVRAKYGKQAWYKDVRGDFSWMILSHTDGELRAMAKDLDWHTPFYYDPMPTLRADRTPQLWIQGGEDYEAPSAETRRRIQSLIDTGLPFTDAYYPKAEHGMTLFETGPDGERLSTRYAPGYFQMLRDFARDGRLSGAYGDAQLSPSR